MDFVNESGLPANWTLGFEPEGRELLVVAIKATYLIPRNGEEPALAEAQAPLTEADEFTGEAGLSAPVHETDYSHRKPRCDVVLNGSAYAPEGRRSTRVEVALRVGSMSKRLYVFGDRMWEAVGPAVFVTDPQPFEVQPFSYDCAFGGVDVDPDRPEKLEAYGENPVGVGFHPIQKRSRLIGKPLPNTSESPSPIEDPTARYRPMAFGPVGRNFFPRYRLAGTYDKEWLENHAPFWPRDFSYSYFQCAPQDQQVVYLEGGEEVILENLTPSGLSYFRVPRRSIPVTVLYYRQVDAPLAASCDTLLIEPDLGVFSMTWRLSLPLRRNCFDVQQLVVGERSYSWHSARRAELAGKTYYRNLAELVNERRKENIAEAEDHAES